MSLSGAASRFAVLPDDDKTDWEAPKSKKDKKKDKKDNQNQNHGKKKKNSQKVSQ